VEDGRQVHPFEQKMQCNLEADEQGSRLHHDYPHTCGSTSAQQQARFGQFSQTSTNKFPDTADNMHDKYGIDQNSECRAQNPSAGSEQVLEEAFNSMLMAWYNSGYATGRYQTLLEISRSHDLGCSNNNNFHINMNKKDDVDTRSDTKRHTNV
jgi:hypothetical protein